jgi:hypothetical protein
VSHYLRLEIYWLGDRAKRCLDIGYWTIGLELKEERWNLLEVERFDVDDLLSIFIKPLEYLPAIQSFRRIYFQETCNDFLEVVIEFCQGEELMNSFLKFMIFKAMFGDIIEIM